MSEFFKEYKDKPTKEIVDVMLTLREEFNKTKSLLVNLSLHIEDIERKFNLLDGELNKRNKK